MLNGRLYRAAVAPLLLSLAIVAFSLSGRPAGAGSTLAPDAFEGAHAFATLKALAARYPDRRPGSAGDEALAAHIARTLEGLGGTGAPSQDGWVGGFSVHVRHLQAQTIDGRRALTTVIAQRPGSTSAPPILIVAHRDAAARGSAAELSGTAALLELARVFASRETKRTIMLASTSGGSGGDGGAADLAASLPGPIDAAIVLGDLAGAHERRPVVVPYSDGFGSAPLALERTVADAIAREAATQPGSPSTAGDLAHLAFPLAPGEQGAIAAHGIPAVLVQVSGERGPAAREAVSAERLEGFGRGVLQAIDALDTAPDVPASAQTGLLLSRKVLPEWALRLLVAALLLGPLLLGVDGLARLRRRRAAVARWTLWTLSCALPFVACALVAYLLGLLGLLSAPALPAPGAAMPFDASAATSVVAVALAFALSWLLRAMLLRRLGWPARPDPDVAGVPLLLILGGVAALAWLSNPYAALLALPALHLWLALVSLDRAAPSRRLLAGALVLAGLLPLVLLVAFYARQLGLGWAGIPSIAWTAVLLLAGGHVGLFAALLWSIALGCAVVAAMLAARPREISPAPTVDDGVRITIRGPLSYAGPGSLGGTESALRR